jgi:murein DD-endopeptidase MepM/ murein hydrolase activator NlpD
MLTDRSGRSAARLARLVRDQEVGGSTPLAPTISFDCSIRNMNQPGHHSPDRAISTGISPRASSRPSSSAFALILVAAGIVALHGMSGCAPAPKYRSHPETDAPAARQTASRDGQIPDLGIDLSPPVKGFSRARITSPFGTGSSKSRRHDGVDIKAGPGEEVLAAASGRVAFSGHKRGYGTVVILDHGNGVGTLYAHLFYACVREGESIGAGDAVGRAGKRGRATGTHLHFEIRLNGSPIDPAPHLWLDSGGEEGS